jgi:hypothetical protein
MPSRILAALLLAVLAQAAGAQTLYKSTMPDGRVVYGDKPAPGAVKSEEQRPDTSKKGIAPPVTREAEAAKKLEQDRLKREGAQDKVSAAEKALRDAQAAQAAGKEPLASERQGTVSGNQRLTEAYWERQKKLDQAVYDAQKKLEQSRK